MPKKRERTTTKASWRTEKMQAALNAVAFGESMRKAAIKFNVPFSTIKDRVKAGKFYGPSLGKKCIFNEEQESEIEKQVLFLQNYFLVSLLDLRRIAYEFAERNGKDNIFSKEWRLTGKDWLYGFVKSHPALTITN
jgi:transposase